MDRYDKYKDSRVEWIGQVPEHWEVRKVKTICRQERYAIKTGPFGTQLKGQELMPEGDVRVYNQRNVIDDNFESVQFYVSKDKSEELSSFITRPNDVLVTSRGTIGKTAVLSKQYPMGILHPCLIALRIDETVCTTEWVKRFFNDTDCFSTNIFLNSNATTIEVIYTETIKSVFIPLPPLSEQRTIAAYLDERCGRIDRVVAAERRRIALLDELRQSIITHTVTRGLNPDTPLKDSGVEWIGQVPEHWEVLPTKRLGKFIKGLCFTKTDLTDIGHSVISYGQIHSKTNDGVHLRKELIRYVPQAFIYESARVSKGDFVFADTSEDYEGCGNCVLNNTGEQLYAGYHTIVLRTSSEENQYLGYLFNTDIWRWQIRSRVGGVKVFSITQSILAQTSIILPPLPEQQAIASYLDTRTAALDARKAKSERRIALLSELKQSIITEAVTGKVKIS